VKHLDILAQGVKHWNDWRSHNRDVVPDLGSADLSGRNLEHIDLSDADLHHATLNGAILNGANLASANLSDAELHGAWLMLAKLPSANLQEAYCHSANFNHAILAGANLRGTTFRAADLQMANLDGADLTGANLLRANLAAASLRDADLSHANLLRAQLVDTDLHNATLNGCNVYGISVWDIRGKIREQKDLVITPPSAPSVTVDNLEVAQFIYLLLQNPKIRDIIDTVTSRVVLILGRFSDERKAVLDALRRELRERGLAPVLFDFDKPANKDTTGTVETLARMARMVIADLTDPSSIPHELATVVPYLRTTPVLPLRLKGSSGYSMFDDLLAYDRWVLPVHHYENAEALIAELAAVLAPAEERLKLLRP
jgi:hypothetical protein